MLPAHARAQRHEVACGLAIPPGAVEAGPRPRVKAELALRPLCGSPACAKSTSWPARREARGRSSGAGALLPRPARRGGCPLLLAPEPRLPVRPAPAGTPQGHPESLSRPAALPAAGGRDEHQATPLVTASEAPLGPVLTAPVQLGPRADHGDRWVTSALSPRGLPAARCQAPVVRAAHCSL